jgi:phospholipid/cholesterol/gamma-HCH transport system permease protein
MKSTRIGARKEFFQMVLLQSYFTYVQSLKLLIISAILVGVVVAFQAQIGLSVLGKLENLAQVINTILFREITPLFVTILIIIRSVTAITSDIATMKVTSEIEALEFMGISIKDYLTGPRIAAGSISFFCMAFTFFCFAFVGFWAALNFNGDVSFGTILFFFIQTLTPVHIFFFFLKTNLIGAIIIYLSCKHGLSLNNATFEIPIVTNRSVVQCLIVGIALQVLITGIAYFFFEVGI